MAFLRTMATQVYRGLPFVIVFPWTVILLITALLAARRRALERRILGQSFKPFWRELAEDAIAGIAAGFLGSLILLYLGITLSTSGFEYLILLAIFLMFFNLRFLCLSYGAGLLSLLSLVTGQPRLHIPGLLALVAVLHVTESFLILARGGIGALPVYLRRDGKTIGGYILQRAWPMPLIYLSATTEILQGTTRVETPPWWPLIGPAAAPGSALTFLLLQAAVALGYGDLALTSPPVDKARRTSFLLILYSLVLLGLAVGSTKVPGLAWLGAVFSPAGHELVLYLARRAELRGKPAFTQEEAGGLTILAVLPGSPAAQAGLEPGRLIKALDGHPVRTKADLQARLQGAPSRIDVTTVGRDGRGERRHELTAGAGGLGLILAPDPDEPAHFNLDSWRLRPGRGNTI